VGYAQAAMSVRRTGRFGKHSVAIFQQLCGIWARMLEIQGIFPPYAKKCGDYK